MDSVIEEVCMTLCYKLYMSYVYCVSVCMCEYACMNANMADVHAGIGSRSSLAVLCAAMKVSHQLLHTHTTSHLFSSLLKSMANSHIYILPFLINSYHVCLLFIYHNYSYISEAYMTFFLMHYLLK